MVLLNIKNILQQMPVQKNRQGKQNQNCFLYTRAHKWRNFDDRKNQNHV